MRQSIRSGAPPVPLAQPPLPHGHYPHHRRRVPARTPAIYRPPNHITAGDGSRPHAHIQRARVFKLLTLYGFFFFFMSVECCRCYSTAHTQPHALRICTRRARQQSFTRSRPAYSGVRRNDTSGPTIPVAYVRTYVLIRYCARFTGYLHVINAASYTPCTVNFFFFKFSINFFFYNFLIKKNFSLFAQSLPFTGRVVLFFKFKYFDAIVGTAI